MIKQYLRSDEKPLEFVIRKFNQTFCPLIGADFIHILFVSSVALLVKQSKRNIPFHYFFIRVFNKNNI